jgi:RND family efflux transporter MFP subunit
MQTLRESLITVETAPVILKTHRPYLTLYGTTVAGREVDLRALVAGQVKTTNAQLIPGGRVNAGDRLLTINPFDYKIDLAEAQAQLAEVKAKLTETDASLRVEQGNLISTQNQLVLAERDLKRAESLAKRGSLAQRKLDDRKLIVLQRKQAVSQSKNTLDVWSARRQQQLATIARLEAVVDRAQQKLKDTVLKAPFDSYVADVGAQVGRMLSVNDRVATLIDRKWLEVRIVLSDAQFSRLSTSAQSLIGRQALVRWQAGHQTIPYSAEIDRIDARADSENGGIRVFARLKDPARPFQIRPGIFVEVELPDAAIDAAFKVPSEAVYNGETVFIVNEDRLQKRRVTVVGIEEAFLVIKGQIAEGERVLITRLARPEAGMRVKVRETSGA